MPGDTIKVEVFAKYRNLSSTAGNLVAFASALTAAFGLNGSMVGDPALAYDALDSYGTIIAGGFDHSEDVDAPKDYLNIIHFDRNYNFVDAAYKQIGIGDIQTDAQTLSGIKAPHGYLSREIIVPEAGYVYIFLSNESPTQVDVYFDDLMITHAKSPVVQMDDYYPFGLSFNSYARENSPPNQYKFNGKELQDELSVGWYDFGAGMYMPEIGRWLSSDPLAELGKDLSPYNYAFNNPLRFVDPDGMWAGVSDPIKDKAAQFGENSQNTGDGNLRKEDDETVEVDSEGNRISEADVEQSFTEGDYEGDDYHQSAEVNDISPNIITDSNDKNEGTIGSYTVDFTLKESWTAEWNNELGETFGLEFTTMRSQHAHGFSTGGLPLFVVMPAEPISYNGRAIWAIQSGNVVAEVQRKYVSSSGQNTFTFSAIERVGSRKISHATLEQIGEHVRQHNQIHNGSFSQKFWRQMFYRRKSDA